MSEMGKPIRAALLMFALFIGGLFLVNGGARWIYNAMPESGVARQNRENREWEQYKVAQRCVLTGNTKTITTYHRVYLTSHSLTRTEHEWKCRGGDVHWRD